MNSDNHHSPSIATIAEDLSLANDVEMTWHRYGPVEDDEVGEFIGVEQFGEDGSVVAAYKVRVLVERVD